MQLEQLMHQMQIPTALLREMKPFVEGYNFRLSKSFLTKSGMLRDDLWARGVGWGLRPLAKVSLTSKKARAPVMVRLEDRRIRRSELDILYG